MNRTKTAIIESFWQLLEEGPYSKITVKSIVDRCQINRNTFYYHFQDIPELLESTIKQEADLIIQSYGKFGAPIDCLVPLTEHCLKHRKALLHIYRSAQRELFLNQLDRICLYAVTQYTETVAKDMTLLPEDEKLLIRFYKCTLTGIFLDWLEDGMNYDLLKAFLRITELLSGSSKQAFLKAAESVPVEHQHI